MLTPYNSVTVQVPETDLAEHISAFLAAAMTAEREGIHGVAKYYRTLAKQWTVLRDDHFAAKRH
jgi:rubrerythrin